MKITAAIFVYGLFLVCIAAASYQIAMLLACVSYLRRQDPEPVGIALPVSILKPVHGLEPAFYEAIRSHALQSYPEFELLFGVSDPDDKVIPVIRRLQAEFPTIRIEIVVCKERGANPKVSKLIELSQHARNPLILVNDSDIRVGPEYLRHIVAPLSDPEIGLVTCLYRVTAKGLPACLEALGIATDFAPSTLVAPLVGVKEFALGSTLLFRAADLERIGKFAVISNYVADDYQLAKRITGLGKRVHLAREVVETSVQDSTWSGVWDHQIRWNRMIRVSRGDGYVGLPVTFATMWAMLAFASGHYLLAAGLVSLRISVALVAGIGVLRCPTAARCWPLIPVRDLFAVAVWAVALFGRTVRWRGENIKLERHGRIVARSAGMSSSGHCRGVKTQ